MTAPIRHDGFIAGSDDLIHELCMALAGQWEPDRLFMIFTAYMDESDTHGPRPNITMGATLGTADQWERFGRGLRRLKREYGFTIFHGTEFKGQTGEFAGWSQQKCEGLLFEFGKLVSGKLTESVTVSLEHEVYKKFFLDVRPPKMHATSQYGFCFLAALDACTKYVFDQGSNHRLSIVVEEGHKNSGDTVRLFKERRDDWSSKGANFLKSITLSSKQDSEFLMIADITTYGASLESKAIKKGLLLPHGQRGYREPGPGETGWTNAEIGPEYFGAVIKQFHDGKAAKHEDWLKRNAAFWEKKARE